MPSLLARLKLNDAGPSSVSRAATDGEVHIWRGQMAELETDQKALEATLSPAELRKAYTMRSEQARRHFVLRRGLLRRVLSGHTGVSAANLVILKDASDKTVLTGWEDLNFSVTSCQDVILVAVTRNRRVGIDLEYIDIEFDYRAVAQRCFAPSELDLLSRMTPQDAKLAFFRIWTRKEAFVKAVGRGIYKRPSIEVPLVEEGPIAIVAGNARRKLAGWRLADVPVAPSFSGAVAVEGYDAVPRFNWSSSEPATA